MCMHTKKSTSIVLLENPWYLDIVLEGQHLLFPGMKALKYGCVQLFERVANCTITLRKPPEYVYKAHMHFVMLRKTN